MHGKVCVSGEYLAVDFLGSEVLARRGQDTLNGEQFTTLTLEKVLIPQEMGQFRIGPAAVGLNVVTGRAPSRSIFDDFFSGSSLSPELTVQPRGDAQTGRPLQ